MIINCNGLESSKHSTEFQALLDLHDPDIVLGTESKLNPDISSYSIFPPSYSVLRRGRNAFGGGFFQAIKSDLASIEEPNFNVDGCEALWSSLKIANRKTLYISSFYRPLNSSTEILDHLDDSLNNAFLRVPNHPNIIMGGDFNLGDIDWNQEIPSTTNPATASQHTKINSCTYLMTTHYPSTLKFQLELHLGKRSTYFYLLIQTVSQMYLRLPA